MAERKRSTQASSKSLVFLLIFLFLLVVAYPFVLPKILDREEEGKELEYILQNTIEIPMTNYDLPEPLPGQEPGEVLAYRRISAPTAAYEPAQTTAPDKRADESYLIHAGPPGSYTGDADTVVTSTFTEAYASETDYYFTAGEEYMEDAIFIGEERTVGLRDYGTLKSATFFASTGLSVFDAMDKKLPIPDMGNISLRELLTVNEYKKVYIMLGIQDFDHPFESMLQEYHRMVSDIRHLQPSAIVFLLGNLHYTAAGSLSDDTVSNKKIDVLNEEFKKLSDERIVFYLDINSVFDDEEGNLNDDYSFDNRNVYARYYTDWSEWILQNAIMTEN